MLRELCPMLLYNVVNEILRKAEIWSTKEKKRAAQSC